MQGFYEKVKRGTPDFPLSFYHHNVSSVLVPYHYHPEFEFIYIIKGKFNITVGLNEYLAEDGDIFFINGRELHFMGENDGHCEFYSFVFHFHILDFENKNSMQNLLDSIKEGKLVLPHKINKKKEYYPALKSHFERFIGTDNNFERLLCIFEMLLMLQKNNALLASENIKSEDKNIKIIKDITNYINQNMSKKITLDELSQTACMSKQYFCSFFKKQTGVTPIEFLNTARIEYAMQMLRAKKNVTETAYDSGFESLSYFIRKFKEQTGMSPSEFKKKNFEI